jgi:hypothetical protein
MRSTIRRRSWTLLRGKAAPGAEGRWRARTGGDAVCAGVSSGNVFGYRQNGS